MREVSSLWSCVRHLCPRIELCAIVRHAVTLQKIQILMLVAVRTSSYMDEVQISDLAH